MPAKVRLQHGTTSVVDFGLVDVLVQGLNKPRHLGLHEGTRDILLPSLSGVCHVNVLSQRWWDWHRMHAMQREGVCAT